MKSITVLATSIALSTTLFAADKFEATLKGHAILPAASFVSVPDEAGKLLKTNGKFAGKKRVDELGVIEGNSNGRPTGVKYPFDAQPVQGHSGIVNLGDNKFAIITDNGLGNKMNSKDSALFYNIYEIDFKSGEFKREKTVFLKDPNKQVPFLLVNEATDSRYLTGGDFDPESIQFVGDFVYIGDEFGPYIIKTDKDGNVVKVAETIVDGKVVKSPDNPSLALPSSPTSKLPSFEVTRSKGFEGMASSKDKTKLYSLLEGALFDANTGKKENVDGKDYLRILEYDVQTDAFTGKSWKYILEDNSHAIGDFNMIDEKYGLIIERDNTEGTKDKACKSGDDKTKCFDDPANFKRVYKIELGDDSVAKKVAYIDLMDIKDPDGVAKNRLWMGNLYFHFLQLKMLI